MSYLYSKGPREELDQQEHNYMLALYSITFGIMVGVGLTVAYLRTQGQVVIENTLALVLIVTITVMVSVVLVTRGVIKAQFSRRRRALDQEQSSENATDDQKKE